MQKIYLLFLVVISVVWSCSPSSKNARNSQNVKTQPADTFSSPGDGLSYKTAVIIHETSETRGVHAEYVWIKEHYINYQVELQSLSTHNRKPYDIIKIKLPDSRELELFFDISGFYGRF